MLFASIQKVNTNQGKDTKNKASLLKNFYLLEKDAFRLYYTFAFTDQQTIDMYVEDSFRQLVQLVQQRQ